MKGNIVIFQSSEPSKGLTLGSCWLISDNKTMFHSGIADLFATLLMAVHHETFAALRKLRILLDVSIQEVGGLLSVHIFSFLLFRPVRQTTGKLLVPQAARQALSTLQSPKK
jgi:hypothetical protein